MKLDRHLSLPGKLHDGHPCRPVVFQIPSVLKKKCYSAHSRTMDHIYIYMTLTLTLLLPCVLLLHQDARTVVHITQSLRVLRTYLDAQQGGKLGMHKQQLSGVGMPQSMAYSLRSDAESQVGRMTMNWPRPS